MYYNKLKSSNKYKGNQGEKKAEKYLLKRGYLFVARNYWTSVGEIDLIFLKGFTLVFVEVKTRSNSLYGTGREDVDYKKRSSIKNAAKEFISTHCKNNKVPIYFWKILIHFKFLKIRYDVIEVGIKKKNYSDEYFIYDHLKSYFQ